MFVKNQDTMSNDSLAIRLREVRRMRKLSMDKLTELVGFIVTNQSFSRYGRGVMRPHANVLSALAKALDISKEYFLGTNLHIDMPMLRTTSRGKLQEDVFTAIEARLRRIRLPRDAWLGKESGCEIENKNKGGLNDEETK